MLSKLTNANFISRGETHKKISLNALNKLNLIIFIGQIDFKMKKITFTF